MKFTLTIETDNDALTDTAELRRLLERAAWQVHEAGRTEAPIIDLYGNEVGSWEYHSGDAPDTRSPAERSAAAYLAQARMTEGDDALRSDDSYAENAITGRCYLLEGNGPTVSFYIVKDNHGQEEFGVFEHVDAYGTTHALVSQHDAEIVDLALRTDREDT